MNPPELVAECAIGLHGPQVTVAANLASTKAGHGLVACENDFWCWVFKAKSPDLDLGRWIYDIWHFSQQAPSIPWHDVYVTQRVGDTLRQVTIHVGRLQIAIEARDLPKVIYHQWADGGIDHGKVLEYIDTIYACSA